MGGGISYLLRSFNERKPDIRTKDWFMVEGPWSVFMCLAIYLWFSVNSKNLMEKRKAFEMKGAMMVYNFVLVLLSFYTAAECAFLAYKSGYNFVCQPVDYSNHPDAIRMARVIWMFYITKFIEMLDTVFFVLRKKFSQVTFLHVYHHVTMPINCWIGMKYVPGGQVFMMCIINSTIHTIMYLYYLLSAIGPHMRKYLWWKRYLTTMQLLQFVTLFTHVFVNFCVECTFPDWINFLSLLYLITQFVLFMNFYMKTYKKADKVELKSE